ncbi:Arginine biosynthesis bifunctional protein ArgJ [Streptomyces griseoloalbus]
MSVTAAKGFTAAGIAAGIKENGNPDLALVVNNGPRRAAAGVFTSNRVKAAPVLWSEQVLKSGQLTAVVLNSGGANACTGPKGFQDTHATAEKAAEVLGTGAGEIAVCSTGLIGVLLPMDKLLPGVETAVAQLSEHGGEKAAIAIKTTDTVHKTAVAGGDGWTVGGIRAETLMVLTDVEGLYEDWPNSDEVISRLTASQLEKLLPDLSSGMVPKMEGCLHAVRNGVNTARVIDGRVQHSILLEIFTDEGIGTMVVPDEQGES